MSPVLPLHNARQAQTGMGVLQRLERGLWNKSMTLMLRATFRATLKAALPDAICEGFGPPRRSSPVFISQGWVGLSLVRAGG